MYEGISSRKSNKNASPRTEKSSVLSKLKYAIPALIGFGGVPYALDAVNTIGTEKFEVQDSYENTLRLVQDDYNARVRNGDPSLLRKDGTRLDFPHFLETKNIPSQDEVTALKRLIAEFKEPVHLHKGAGVISRALETDFGKKELFSAGSYKSTYEGDGHEIFIYPEDHLKDTTAREEEAKYFTRNDVAYIVSELAHAVQDEQGKKEKMEEDSMKNVMLKDRNIAYETSGNVEYEAHSVIEPVLEARMHELRDSYRTESVKEMQRFLPSIGYRAPEGFLEGNMSFQDFSGFLDALEHGYNKKTYGAQKVMDVIYRMPGFEATFEWEVTGEPAVLKDIPANEKLYGSLRAFLKPYEGPTDTAKAYVTRVLESKPINTLVDAPRIKPKEFVPDTKFDIYAAKFRPTVARALGFDLTNTKEFSLNRYEKMQRYIASYAKGERSSDEMVNKALATLSEIDSYLTQQGLAQESKEARYEKFKALYAKSKPFVG